MKVYIGKYKNWFGPYQLAELLCFWAKKEKDEYGFESTADWVHNFGEFLAHGFHKETAEQEKRWFNKRERPTTFLYKFLLWIDKLKNKVPRHYIKIDKYDTWSMDNTLAIIILPMLKQLKATKHGSHQVELEDVPEYMRTITHEEYEDQKSFDFYHEDKEERKYDVHDRWNYVLDEMIFAFDHLVDDTWEEKYSKGETDYYNEPCAWYEDGKPKLYEMKRGPNHTYECDYDGLQKEWDRVHNGLRLFGKYYRGLWD